MLTKKQKQVCMAVLKDYQRYSRNLPWRHTRNPYRLFVSEIMLQQTQVDRVIPIYTAFLKQFPNKKQLATAKTCNVIRAWKGLGYNRRALYLQQTIQIIQKEFAGHFPRDLKTLLKLPGIGPYTARAILSFAFGQAVPMMDTNHRKFYQQTFFQKEQQTDNKLLKKAEEVIIWLVDETGESSVYDWNQALMDWGAALPKEKKRKVKKKKLYVPFKETDRYLRGRIIDLLRESYQCSLKQLEKHFADIKKDRLERVLSSLAFDGLILRTKTSILLPE